MSAYTSGYRAAHGLAPANHDPEPWVQEDDYGNVAGRSPYPVPRYGHWDFRPEYAELDNPILAAFRKFSFPTRWHYEHWLRTMDDPDIMVQAAADPRHAFHAAATATLEQGDHARRVLSKLAALS